MAVHVLFLFSFQIKCRPIDLLADAEGDFEREIERGVLVESLHGLHAQVAVAGVAGGAGRAAAVAHHGLELAPARRVRLAAGHRPVTGALVDRVDAAVVRAGRRRRLLAP